MTREQFKSTNWEMSYEEFQICDCVMCNQKDCIHKDAFRRVPRIDGGLGLCPKLDSMKKVKDIILDKCNERETAGYSNLVDSDVADILSECERLGLPIGRRELRIIGLR